MSLQGIASLAADVTNDVAHTVTMTSSRLLAMTALPCVLTSNPLLFVVTLHFYKHLLIPATGLVAAAEPDVVSTRSPPAAPRPAAFLGQNEQQQTFYKLNLYVVHTILNGLHA